MDEKSIAENEIKSMETGTKTTLWVKANAWKLWERERE